MPHGRRRIGYERGRQDAGHPQGHRADYSGDPKEFGVAVGELAGLATERKGSVAGFKVG